MAAGKHRKSDSDATSEVQAETGKDKSSGNHVGLAHPDDALDVGETGAEARGAQR